MGVDKEGSQKCTKEMNSIKQANINSRFNVLHFLGSRRQVSVYDFREVCGYDLATA